MVFSNELYNFFLDFRAEHFLSEAHFYGAHKASSEFVSSDSDLFDDSSCDEVIIPIITKDRNKHSSQT